MKKIFTLLFCTAFISSSIAQTGHENGNNINVNYYYAKSAEYHYNDQQNYIDSYQNIISQRDQEIRKVNYWNNYHVQMVVNDCDLNIWEKRDILDNLETQRIHNINNIYDRYSNTIAYYHINERNNIFKSQYLQDDDRR